MGSPDGTDLDEQHLRQRSRQDLAPVKWVVLAVIAFWAGLIGVIAWKADAFDVAVWIARAFIGLLVAGVIWAGWMAWKADGDK